MKSQSQSLGLGAKYIGSVSVRAKGLWEGSKRGCTVANIPSDVLGL